MKFPHLRHQWETVLANAEAAFRKDNLPADIGFMYSGRLESCHCMAKRIWIDGIPWPTEVGGLL